MTRSWWTVAALAATVGLSACERPAIAANTKLCANFKGGAATVSTDGSAPVEDCLRRWAYSLASSRDAADAVADATVAACQGALSRWNQQAATQAGQEGSDEALSIITGQQTNPLVEHYSFAQSHALLYVVEARAGNCAPPDVVDGRPAGTTA
jgi:hypothetical protein